MKQFVFLLVIGLLFFACTDTMYKTRRKQLLNELTNLEATLKSNNKKNIEQLFTFPLYDSAFDIYINDSAYQMESEKNGSKITEAIFSKYFSQISGELEFKRLKEVFKYLSVDSLIQKDSFEFEVRSKKEPCYRFYDSYINKDTITLVFGTNTNEAYVDESKKTDEDEGFGDECEYASTWIFRFDGKRLYLIRHLVAG